MPSSSSIEELLKDTTKPTQSCSLTHFIRPIKVLITKKPTASVSCAYALSIKSRSPAQIYSFMEVLISLSTYIYVFITQPSIYRVIVNFCYICHERLRYCPDNILTIDQDYTMVWFPVSLLKTRMPLSTCATMVRVRFT